MISFAQSIGQLVEDEYNILAKTFQILDDIGGLQTWALDSKTLHVRCHC